MATSERLAEESLLGLKSVATARSIRRGSRKVPILRRGFLEPANNKLDCHSFDYIRLKKHY